MLSGREHGQDLVLSGELSGGSFGIDQYAVNDNFKHAAAGFNQCNIDGKLPGDLGRQTGGARTVSSAIAVFDADIHYSVPQPNRLPVLPMGSRRVSRAVFSRNAGTSSLFIRAIFFISSKGTSAS